MGTTFGLDKTLVVERKIPPTRIDLSLPMLPPSTNNLYFNNKRGGRTKTEKYESWIVAAGLILNRQQPGRFTSPAHLSFEVEDIHPLRDISNVVKPIEDLLVKCGIIPNDNAKHVRQITAKWSTGFQGVRITITAAGRGA